MARCNGVRASGMQIKPAGANVPKSHRAGPNHVASCACALVLAHGLAASGPRAPTSYSLAAHIMHARICKRHANQAGRGKRAQIPSGGAKSRRLMCMCPYSCPWIGRIRPAGFH